MPERRRIVPCTCALHGGAATFANLALSKEPDGRIRFDPHVTGACVLVFAEDGACSLRDILMEWLG